MDADLVVSARNAVEDQKEQILAWVRGMEPGMERTWLGAAGQSLKLAGRALDRAIAEGERE